MVEQGHFRSLNTQVVVLRIEAARFDVRVLVFGKSGQVATELQRQYSLVALGREDMDFEFPERFEAVIDEFRADIIINAAAYTDVDGAEDDEELAMKINGVAPTILAEKAAERDIPFLHISTDYVFDGCGDRPWAESDRPNPVNAYGRSKLEGEIGITRSGGIFAILRTSWVFSSTGKNFVKTMLRLNSYGDKVGVVSDQVGSPTAASDLAGVLLTMASAFKEGRGESGIYHFAGAPDTCWAEFARKIVSLVGGNLKVIDIPSSEFPTRAKRPSNSRMDCTKLKDVFAIKRPNWSDSLNTVIAQLQEQNHGSS